MDVRWYVIMCANANTKGKPIENCLEQWNKICKFINSLQWMLWMRCYECIAMRERGQGARGRERERDAWILIFANGFLLPFINDNIKNQITCCEQRRLLSGRSWPRIVCCMYGGRGKSLIHFNDIFEIIIGNLIEFRPAFASYYHQLNISHYCIVPYLSFYHRFITVATLLSSWRKCIM